MFYISIALVCLSSLCIIHNLYTSYLANKEYRDIDTDNLLEQNSEYMGWLYIEDIVDLPVVQTDNNTYYLSHSFNKEENKMGCLFIDKNVLPDGNNMIIHGHNNYNSSMFSLLTKYKDTDFFNTHKEIIFTTKENEIRKYSVLAVINYDVSTMNEFNMYNIAATSTYIEEVEKLSLYPFDKDFKDGMKFITLSTCDEALYGSNGRLVIIGVML